MNNREFNWLDATLEVYSISGCGDYPSGPMTYSNLRVTDNSGRAITPQWGAGVRTECGGSETVESPSEIVIQHTG